MISTAAKQLGNVAYNANFDSFRDRRRAEHAGTSYDRAGVGAT
jgi:hypothetical protein